MAVIKLKRGTTDPTTSNIEDGEVAINKTNKTIHMNDGGTIKQLGGTPGIDDQATSAKLTINSNGTIEGMWSNNNVANLTSKMTVLSQAQYDAITVKDNDTLYFIT